LKIDSKNKPALDLYRKIKWLIFFRALFAVVLLGSAAIVGIQESSSSLNESLLFLYGISILLLFFSTGYALILPRTKRLVLLSSIQMIIDTFFVTAIIFATGCFSSVFSFLYLVVIIYSGQVIFRKGGMIIAAFCSIQYGLLIDLEYFGMINPMGFGTNFLMMNYQWNYVLYKLVITIVACFGVAILSGFLSEQERRAKKDLWAMEDQVKRVEKLAAIGDMASGLVHEIKNPLASLSGSIQVLRDEIPYDPDHDKLMEIILREADRLSTLANDFLVFARPQPGQTQVIELGHALDEIVKYFVTDSRRNKRIAVSKEFSEGIFIEIDPEHLRQVIWNLLLNADEAIENDGKIDVKMFPLNKKHACITITDNGCGMTVDTLQSIFDPFFTVKSKGTGLGLSIVQRIITSYNGLIDVKSKTGQGTTFTVKLNRVLKPLPPKTQS
jgi:signal transduction histidine kinase